MVHALKDFLKSIKINQAELKKRKNDFETLLLNDDENYDDQNGYEYTEDDDIINDEGDSNLNIFNIRRASSMQRMNLAGHNR